MAAPAESIEQQLISDLHQVQERFRDEKFMTELYRALSSTVWFKDDPSDRIALSWKLSAELVDALRTEVGEQPMDLFRSGGEGTVDRTIDEELGPRGWHHEPLDTGEHDPSHVASPEDPPPQSRREGHRREE